jgi:hypothetical protein
VDHRDSSPPWTGLRRRSEELTGVRSRASPEVEEQHGGRATAVKARRHRCSVRVLLRRGERGKEAGRGVVKLGGGYLPFIGGRDARGGNASG